MTVEMVVPLIVVQEPVRTVVVMFVYGIQVVGPAEFPQGMVIATRIVGARRADDLDGRVLGTHGVGDEHESFPEFGDVIFFVAQTEILQIEGGGVSHGGPDLAPGCGAVTVGEFNQVEGIIHPFLHLIHGGYFTVPELAGNTDRQHGQGLAVDVFAVLEVFVEA